MTKNFYWVYGSYIKKVDDFMNYYTYRTKIGELTFASKGEHLVALDFGRVKKEGEYKENKVLKNASTQVNEYLDGKRKIFTIALELEGTEFQKLVWRALLNIDYGTTLTYKDIACAIGREKAYRAVGGANNKNPIAIIVPCHRVIGANNKLVGYAGGLHIKEKLLKIEGENK